MKLSGLVKALSSLNALVTVAVPFSVFILFAREMPPEQIGVFSLAIAAIEILKVLFPLGVYETLLTSRNYEKLARASGLMLLLVGAISAAFYAVYVAFIPTLNHINIDDIAPYLYLLALKAVFDVLLLQPLAAVAREKNYVKLNLRSLIANIVAAAVGLSALYLTSPFWGLSLYYITLSVTSYLAIVITDFRVLRLGFDLSAIREEWRTISMASQIRTMAAVNNYGDQFLSGIFLGPHAMALYNLGKRAEIAQSSAMQAFTVNIFHPQFARARGRTLKRDYNRALFTVTMLMGIPGMIFIANARGIVETVLGSEWLEAVPIVCALMISGFFRSAASVQGAWFSVTKFITFLRNRTIVYTVVSLGLILLAPLAGLVVVAWLVALKNLAFYVLSIRFTRHLANWRRFVTHMLAPLAVAFTAAFAVSNGADYLHWLQGQFSVIKWALSGAAACMTVFAIWRRSLLSVAKS